MKKITKSITGRIRTGYNVIVPVAILLGIMAKVKKDIRTHAEHDEHNPCDCYPQCLGCLVG